MREGGGWEVGKGRQKAGTGGRSDHLIFSCMDGHTHTHTHTNTTLTCYECTKRVNVLVIFPLLFFLSDHTPLPSTRFQGNLTLCLSTRNSPKAHLSSSLIVSRYLQVHGGRRREHHTHHHSSLHCTTPHIHTFGGFTTFFANCLYGNQAIVPSC